MSAAELIENPHKIEAIKHNIDEDCYYYIQNIVAQTIKEVTDKTGQHLHDLIQHNLL